MKKCYQIIPTGDQNSQDRKYCICILSPVHRDLSQLRDVELTQLDCCDLESGPAKSMSTIRGYGEHQPAVRLCSLEDVVLLLQSSTTSF